MRFFSREFSLFMFWGGINTLSGYLIYLLLLSLSIPYLVSYTITFALSIVISYLFNSKFVFKESLRLSKALKYPVVYLIQYLLGVVLMYVLVQMLNVPKELAPLFVVLLTIPVTFLLSRRIVKGPSDIKQRLVGRSTK